jgi:hypothetical protein
LIQPDAILFRIVVDSSVTVNGRALDEPIAQYVGECGRSVVQTVATTA